MISLIICSRKSDVAASFRQNIDATIGCPHEFVVVDNHDNHHTIFTAYNEGVSRAKGDVLCFMHDDVCMHTAAWGEKVEAYLQDPAIGLLGVVGSHVIPEKGDWRVGYTEFNVLSFVQRNPTFGAHPTYYTKLTCEGLVGQLTEVAALDGVWFCMRRELFTDRGIRFDSDTFGSFHIYDVDLSLQVGALGLKLFVCDDILLEHFSEGNYSTGFLNSLELLQRKWCGTLPVIRGTVANPSDLRARGDRALEELKQRIRRDADLAGIRAYWKSLAAGESVAPLTERQKRIISAAEFLYVKTAVKFYPDAAGLRQMMRRYLADPIMGHKALLVWKYFIYRVLHIRPRKSTNTFPAHE